MVRRSLLLNNSILKTISFSDIQQWDVKYFFQTKVQSKYKISTIGQHTIHITKKVKLFEEPEKKFKILGISNDIGMFDAYEEYGKNINQPYIYVEKDYLAYNPYRVNVGSIGIKTDSLKNDFISPAYVVFKCKDTLLPEYLFLVMKSSIFNGLIKENTTGAVRQTLSYEKLANISIPIPSINEQQLIIDQFYSNIVKINSLNEDITKLELSIDKYILNVLGVQVEQQCYKSGGNINLINLSDLHRWDVWSKNKTIVTKKYNFSKMSTLVLGDPLYGANEKTIKEKTDVRYIRITDINEDGSLNNEYVSAKNVDSKYLLKENDFLIARSGNTVGKTFLYKERYGKCIFAGYLIKFVLNRNLVLPEYLLYYTKSSIFKAWIDNNQRIFGQPNINGQEYMDADIIIPDLNIQSEIVSFVDETRKVINDKKLLIDRLNLESKKMFEETIFS